MKHITTLSFSKKIIALSMMFNCMLVVGQTNPIPQSLPYYQNFSGLVHASTIYPTGIQGWQLSSSSPGSTFRTSAPLGNISLRANSNASDTRWDFVHNYNGKIGFLHSNNGESSIVLAINTALSSNVQVKYNVMTIRNPYNGSSNTRISETILQYRIGSTGVFTNLTTVAYRNNTTSQTSGTNPQNLQNRTVVLPAVCNNKPTVQLRWVSRDVSGSGNRPSIAIDDIAISSIGAVITTNGLPSSLTTIYGLASSATTFTVSASNLTSNVTVTPPSGFEVSTSQFSGYSNTLTLAQSAGTLATTSVFIRLAATSSAGNYNGNVVITSGTTSVNVPTALSVINKKELTITGISISDKLFDGTTTASISGTAILNGIIGIDDVSISGTPIALFADALVGNNKPVSISGYTLAGTKSINYSLLQPSGLTGTILPAPVTPQQMVERMGTGINLGNILSAPFEGNWAAALTEDYVDNVARMRFKHVRIPIRFDNQTTPFSSVTYTDANGNYIGSPANYVVNTTYLDRIEEIITWCLNRDLVVIIDVHGDHWFWESYDSTSPNYKTGNDRLAAIDRFKAIWRDISVRFQHKPDPVLFEIMNEPFFSMNAQEVIDINTQMLAIIRQTNPTRNVIVTGGGANSFEAPMQLSSAFLSSDDYLIATYHYYRPFSFTSSASQQYTDNDWGTTTDKNTVNSHFDQLQLWSQTNSIPVYMGEFGADNVNGFNYFNNVSGLYGGPDANSRFLYHQFIAEAARARGFALAVWDSGEKSGKTLYLNTPQSWVKDIRNAVLNTTCENQSFINNSNIECNYDYYWNTNFNTGYTGKLNNSSVVDGFQNSVSLHLKVNATQGSFDGITISNSNFTSNFVSGSSYTLRCVAKGSSSQQFQYRIKVISNGVTSFLNSSTYTLSSQYLNYDYDFTLPENTSQVTVQLLCGNDTGDYFFDNFEVIGDSARLTRESSNLIISPNPASKTIQIQNNKPVTVEAIHNSLGQKVENYEVKGNSVDISSLQNGIYIITLSDENSTLTQKKIIINK